MPGKMEFEFRFGSGGNQGAAPRDAESPMRILILGDFSGRESRGIVETGDLLASRPILRVDVDTPTERNLESNRSKWSTRRTL